MSNNSRAKEYGVTENEVFVDFINDLDEDDHKRMKSWYEKRNDGGGSTPFNKFLQAMDRSLADDRSKLQRLGISMERYIDEMMGVYSGEPENTVRVLQKE